MKQSLRPAALAMVVGLVAGCRTSHDIHTVSEVKPIHITIDVNIKVDKALDNFFGDIDEAGATEVSEKKGAQTQ